MSDTFDHYAGAIDNLGKAEWRQNMNTKYKCYGKVWGLRHNRVMEMVVIGVYIEATLEANRYSVSYATSFHGDKDSKFARMYFQEKDLFPTKQDLLESL